MLQPLHGISCEGQSSIMRAATLTTVLLSLFAACGRVGATQSVYSCPVGSIGFGGLPGMYPGYGAGIGEVCGIGSFIHYWTCCEYAPFECCLQLETWAIVFFSVLIVLLIGTCLFAIGRYFTSQE